MTIINIYLDNAATTMPSKEVIEAVSTSMEEFYGNPSAVYSLGVNSAKKLDECRETIAKTINASKDEIYFTSCGSEGNNLVLRGILKKGLHVITTSFEHSSVKNTIGKLESIGVDVTYLPVDKMGEINIDELKKSIRKETALVSVMHVNNEIGSIQNIKEIGLAIKEVSSRAKFHVDAVQSYGKLPIDVKDMKIDSLTVSAHKINGPKGVGFCYLSKGISPMPLIIGGAQEKGLRAGTQNVSGVIGLTVAALNKFEQIDENYQKVLEIKTHMINKLSTVHNIKINSPLDNCFSPYLLNVSFIGARGEILLNYLSGEGIFVSTGSACTSKSKAGVVGSHVLEALGLSADEITSAIRFSFSNDTTALEIDRTVEVINNGLSVFRRNKK